MSSEPPLGAAPVSAAHAALLADLGWLVDLLRVRVAHQEGDDFVSLADRVLVLTEQAAAEPRSAQADELRSLLSEVDLDTATRLARAFSMGFHVGNVTEQVHRIEALSEDLGDRAGWLNRLADRIRGTGVEPQVLQDALSGLDVRPVFTAHPTEVARGSVLGKLRQLADLLQARRDPRA
jgi:phosphoenolpyruvate carboxylase